MSVLSSPRYVALAVALMACVVSRVSDGLELTNGVIELELDSNANGVPHIESAEWVEGNDRIFRQKRTDAELGVWALNDGLPASVAKPTPWQETPQTAFLQAQTARVLEDGLVMTWVVELPREGSLFRAYVTLTNAGSKARPVASFPIWSAVWKLAGDAESLVWWKALSFEPQTRSLAKETQVTLGSRLHSSDTRLSPGVNPYWVVKGTKNNFYFALDWCGGWHANLKASANDLAFSVLLPPVETQLILDPGETLSGPVLNIAVTRASDDLTSRADWMRQRLSLARTLYGGPGPAFPIAYNNWYTTRFNFDSAFLQRQVDTMDPYDFDFFIVDAGWYKACGQWEPDPKKFPDDSFESILKAARAKGPRIGIWTCPQFVKASADALPPEVDQPGFYEKFIDGHLLDLAGMDCSQSFLDHVTALRSRYGADWWKYDQIFFAEQTRHGVLRNVKAFQDAVLAVRKAYPDLFIENCQSGGRMINEFTVLCTQNQWIRDGGDTGLEHGRSNLREALGAIEFMPPWTVNRWTNNPDRNDQNDDEFTKFYCRCAMPGTWGIVADLAKIGERQRNVIVEEIAHYRRLNAIKAACRYEVHYPSEKDDVAGITFYDDEGRRAGALVCRWDASGAFIHTIPCVALAEARGFRVEDVDTGETQEVDGAWLRENGLPVAFGSKRMSAMVFIESLD